MAFPHDEEQGTGRYAGTSTGKELERRKLARAVASSSVELIRKDESGKRVIESGQAVDVSSGGMAIQASEPLAAASCLILRAPTVGIVALAQVRHCSWNRSAYRVGMRFLMKAELPFSDKDADPDYHEFLREAVSCDPERAGNLHQVYRSLSFRYHPDNRDTGDAEIFLCVGEIYRIVSGPARELARRGTRAGGSRCSKLVSQTERGKGPASQRARSSLSKKDVRLQRCESVDARHSRDYGFDFGSAGICPLVSPGERPRYGQRFRGLLDHGRWGGCV